MNAPFDEGLQLGARIENRIAVQSIVTALLQVLGKDKGDGIINLGAAGRWYPGDESGLAEAQEPLDYRERINGATK
jgi:hypothetical protein